ncbi:uncharacterized protein PHACADRAFT_181292 [Phanerochaete carnosa HHB-10118-sp]|uniref:Uncharacterized protein n=1 Tax=Phanerochaete carnosa (strain HHB-10118-sp) TaxID=650164 RepID=K5V904_PHACS|nr:uncharacterized protein PHACADRAFT_181292 [Phanerochaete carnosa HHB-10118-sp]EKM59286.1 hypothetical protein PHACADRAFT_181292 [Phanerochaete carnosa HHB-10118-sp]
MIPLAEDIAPADVVLGDRTTPNAGSNSNSPVTGLSNSKGPSGTSSHRLSTTILPVEKLKPAAGTNAGARGVDAAANMIDRDVRPNQRKKELPEILSDASSVASDECVTAEDEPLANGMDVDEPSNAPQGTTTATSSVLGPGALDGRMSPKGCLPAAPFIPPTTPTDIHRRYYSWHVSDPGLVDKVIIAQDPFGRFVNDICPGAYQSVTHVNFKALDDFSVRPIGIYDPKSEIVRYTKDLGLISHENAQTLLSGKDDMPATRALRSGLYVFRNVSLGLVCVIFWPQDTTWDDDAISSVARNRVTFMRYLTKIADQIVVLVPDDFSDSMILAEEAPAEPVEDSVDRLFTFEVMKTREEEENVIATEGFKINNLQLGLERAPDNTSIPTELFRPRLIPGETCLGFMLISYQMARTMQSAKIEEYPRTRLSELIKKRSFVLASSLSEDAFGILVKFGLPAFVEDDYRQLEEQRKSLTADLNKEELEVFDRLGSTLREQNPLLVDTLFTEAAAVVEGTFGACCVNTQMMTHLVNIRIAAELLEHLNALHRDVGKYRRTLLSDHRLKTIGVKSFTAQKEKIIKLQTSGNQANSALGHSEKGSEEKTASGLWVMNVATRAASKAISTIVPGPVFGPAHHNSHSQRMPDDIDFLCTLPAVTNASPEVAAEAHEAIAIARRNFTDYIWTSVNKVARRIEDLQRDECEKQLQVHRKRPIVNTWDDSRRTFIARIQNSFVRDPDDVFEIEDVQNISSSWPTDGSFRLSGISQWKNEASLKHAISPLYLTETDEQAMRLDKTHVPTPRLQNSAYSFDLTLNHRILFIQLLHDSRCLLIARNEAGGDVSIYLERLIDLDNAVKFSRRKKVLSADKLHGDLLFSFDETKRMLAVCTIGKLHVHAFVFDEHYRNLQGLGSTIELSPWYDQHIKLVHMIFRCGADEELLLVDNTGRARILSLTTQQFRPASLQLPSSTRSLKSSPDGSCFFALEPLRNRLLLRAYHWASFGSSRGISAELPAILFDSLEITTFSLSTLPRPACTPKLYISRTRAQSSPSVLTTETPIAIMGRRRSPAVPLLIATAMSGPDFLLCQRSAGVLSSFRNELADHLTFVSYLPSQLLSTYFSDMIISFERATHKPVEDELANIDVSGMTYSVFMKQGDQVVSQLRASEWLVDILCLIPIHIAIAHDNRFVPLKDGVWSADFERDLLGATVERVVDKLTFGWYESIFKSYMAAKVRG